MTRNEDAHLRAAARHDEARERHERAAVYWDERGAPERADFERRNIQIELAAADLERDRADFERRRPLLPERHRR